MEMLWLTNILLWAVVIVEGILIFALTRQVGVLFERVAPAGALAMNQQLSVGKFAPELKLNSLFHGAINIGGNQLERAQLLFFLSPDCPVCKTLLPTLLSAAKVESDWMDLIIASDGKQQDHETFSTSHQLSAYPYLVSEQLGRSFGVAKLPYGVLIDEQGKIAAFGIINSREHLDSLFEAKEKQVASIQEHFKRSGLAQNAAEVTQQ